MFLRAVRCDTCKYTIDTPDGHFTLPENWTSQFDKQGIFKLQFCEVCSCKTQLNLILSQSHLLNNDRIQIDGTLNSGFFTYRQNRKAESEMLLKVTRYFTKKYCSRPGQIVIEGEPH